MVAALRNVQIERLVVIIRVLVGVNGNSETAPPRTDANRLLCCSVIVAAFSGRVAAVVGRIVIGLCLTRTPDNRTVNLRVLPSVAESLPTEEMVGLVTASSLSANGAGGPGQRVTRCPAARMLAGGVRNVDIELFVRLVFRIVDGRDGNGFARLPHC